MTWQSTLTLFTAMLLLAALPSTSVWLVVGHSLSGGIRQGLAVATGIVAADLLLIAVAIGGLSLVATALAPWSGLIRSLSGLYLILLGWQRLRSAPKPLATSDPASSKTIVASGLLGFSISLADQKALLFYFGFLPAFVESTALLAQYRYRNYYGDCDYCRGWSESHLCFDGYSFNSPVSAASSYTAPALSRADAWWRRSLFVSYS